MRLIVVFPGQFGPAIALIAASYTGCDPYLTVGILTVGVGLNGAIYSGFKVNHLDISPRFAGILMSLTNCLANLAGLLAPIVAGYVIDKRVSSWKTSRSNYLNVYFLYATCTFRPRSPTLVDNRGPQPRSKCKVQVSGGLKSQRSVFPLLSAQVSFGLTGH